MHCAPRVLGVLSIHRDQGGLKGRVSALSPKQVDFFWFHFLVRVHLLHHTLQRTGLPCSLGFAVYNVPRTAHLLAGGVSG